MELLLFDHGVLAKKVVKTKRGNFFMVYTCKKTAYKLTFFLVIFIF